MFSRLFGSKDKIKRPAARVPDGMRVYAIGDIHGRADLLAAMHQGINADLAQNKPAGEAVLVYVGDYIDRGMQSRQVIDHILSNPVPGATKIYLKGNHDDSALQFLHDAEFGPIWFSYGGDATILSYGVRMTAGKVGADRFEDMRQQFEAALPPAHLEFLTGLQSMYLCGDYLFVHAGVRPGVALPDQKPEDLMWIRDEFLGSREDHGKMVVHGHTVTTAPEQKDNRIGIDTGAYASNRLTCLILEGDRREFIATKKASRGSAEITVAPAN
ncbi:MAG: metallophosphoesterase family protein [Rhodospirillales bacterium]